MNTKNYKRELTLKTGQVKRYCFNLIQTLQRIQILYQRTSRSSQ